MLPKLGTGPKKKVSQIRLGKIFKKINGNIKKPVKIQNNLILAYLRKTLF